MCWSGRHLPAHPMPPRESGKVSRVRVKGRPLGRSTVSIPLHYSDSLILPSSRARVGQTTLNSRSEQSSSLHTRDYRSHSEKQCRGFSQGSCGVSEHYLSAALSEWQDVSPILSKHDLIGCHPAGSGVLFAASFAYDEAPFFHPFVHPATLTTSTPFFGLS